MSPSNQSRKLIPQWKQVDSSFFPVMQKKFGISKNDNIKLKKLLFKKFL